MIDRPRRKAALALVVAATLAAPHSLDAGPGAAGRGPRPARNAHPDPARADEVVVVWYRLDDPLGTFRYRIYDVRKGEYTPAVDAWLDLMHRQFPRYEARALPVDLALEEGSTEKLKVGSVIRRELLLAAARSGVVPGAPIAIRPATETPPSHPLARPELPGAGGSSSINPVTPPSPFPMPYVRPHP
jgi:hypothetical protein